MFWHRHLYEWSSYVARFVSTETDVAGVQIAICAERLREVMCEERGKRESETREREQRKNTCLLLPVCLLQSDKFHTLSSALSRTSEREPHLEAKGPQQRHLLNHVGNKLRTTRRSRGGAARGGGTPSSTSKAPGSSGRRRTFLHTTATKSGGRNRIW